MRSLCFVLFIGAVTSSLMTLQLNPDWLAQQNKDKAVITPDVMEQFQKFQVHYNKSYTTEEEWAHRVGVFAENLKEAERNNAEERATGGSAEFGVTKFMDLTQAEFTDRYLKARPNSADIPFVDINTTVPNAESVDWRTKNVITKVKDQGQCGSCWAFSATEAIESYAALSGKYKLTDLSPQQIVSCDKVDLGCNGGDTISAYKYVLKAGGLTTSKDYPYASKNSGKSYHCKHKVPKDPVKITGYKQFPKNEAGLKAGLNAGPVSICVATGKWQTYRKGVLSKCPGSVDHCVQAVGYDDTHEKPYWLVRNSWNTDWGEEGYIRIEQGKDLCKIASEATYPTF